ncbi:hypothetical protein IE53DRAFT_228848 [Violaceomyces palustris]|uniref:Uncharacterized protein n=1 Tax=Violaceomyces palustris TaxID=1673888 RepID=A0ACD0P4E7_9BASI|nr:hypothetical protein IE53DRAFT_228848 [Violaceomyces palustris]
MSPNSLPSLIPGIYSTINPRHTSSVSISRIVRGQRAGGWSGPSGHQVDSWSFLSFRSRQPSRSDPSSSRSQSYSTLSSDASVKIGRKGEKGDGACGSNSGSSGKQPSIRAYKYFVDVHGQLFLHDTVPKNLTSCFKDKDFLNFFFTRLRPNPLLPSLNSSHFKAGSHSKYEGRRDLSLISSSIGTVPENWDLLAGLTIRQADEYALSQGYLWQSPCGKELNYIRSEDTPIVYRELDEKNNQLRWAGDLFQTFMPDSLKVDLETGYVYHPSPTLPKKSEQESRKRLGEYSLISSQVLISHFSKSLELDPNDCDEGGAFFWKGKRWSIGIL